MGVSLIVNGTNSAPGPGLEMSGDERRLLVAMLRDELDRGWIPQRSDLVALLALVRARPGTAHSSSPSW